MIESFKYKDSNSGKTNIVELHEVYGRLGEIHEVWIKNRNKVLSIKSFKDSVTARNMYENLKKTLI